MSFARLLRAPLAAGALFLLSTASLIAAPGDKSPDGLWEESPDAPLRSRTGSVNRIRASTYRLFTLDAVGVKAALAKAPVEAMRRTAAGTPIILNLPAPDGTFQRFLVEESSIMEPKLQAEFPDFRTYVGRGIDDPAASARISVTLLGFHAQVLTPKGAWYVDPFYHLEQSLYMSYAKKDALRGKDGWQCFTEEGQKDVFASIRRADGSLPDAGPSGAQLRTYRLALACTGEYAAVFGGTVSGAFAAMVVAVNRVVGVYELEVAVRMVLVANNQSLVYTNAATDPYTPPSTSTLLSQNQSNVTAVIGTANFDIGHLFYTGGGGVATLNAVCNSSLKARGLTGLPNPVGDPFYIDYVAHEMGHQFGGNHTFNSSTGSCGGGNRSANSAYETGSGTTIMAYAGICGADNTQPNSDPYFHTRSFDEIFTNITTLTASACPVVTATGNNPPTVSTFAAGTYTIPNTTPFALTASGSDPDGDALTYCWEQFNLGGTQVVGADNGAGPIFRSFNPTASPTRVFPRISTLLGGPAAIGETLPFYTTLPTRTLTFRVTARDNRAGGGGVVQGNTSVTVATAAGPFVVTSQNNTNISYVGGSQVTVTWNVAGTTANGINAANVNIRLSITGGTNGSNSELVFPYTVAQNVPNNGSATVTLPYVSGAQCRFKVEPTNNIFFAVNTLNFAITAASDSDLDGLPDAYETANGLNPNNAADAALDSDGDGESNLSEFRSGTNPQNPSDYLRITSNTRAAGGETITFPSKLNFTYRIERSTDLLSGWTTLFDNIPGTGADISRTDAAATGATKFFYRAVTVP